MNRKILHNYFSGKATDDEKKMIANWLDQDPLHQEEMTRERNLYNILLFAKEEKTTGRPQTYTKTIGLGNLLKVAAVVLLLVGAGTYLFKQTYPAIPFQQEQIISVPAGQRTNITLPDGSKICLNSNSELRYSTFSGKQRKVYLRGEAYFDVTHDPQNKFIVQTEEYSIEVLGTQFNVEAYPNYQFVTSLQSGKVKVVSNKNPAEPVILSTGQQAMEENNRMAVKNITNMDLFRWIEGIVCFENASFQTLMKQFEKSYGIQIQIQNPGIDNEFTGKLRISDGIEHALRTLQKNTNFTYYRDDEQNTIYIK